MPALAELISEFIPLHFSRTGPRFREKATTCCIFPRQLAQKIIRSRFAVIPSTTLLKLGLSEDEMIGLLEAHHGANRSCSHYTPSMFFVRFQRSCTTKQEPSIHSARGGHRRAPVRPKLERRCGACSCISPSRTFSNLHRPSWPRTRLRTRGNCPACSCLGPSTARRNNAHPPQHIRGLGLTPPHPCSVTVVMHPYMATIAG